MDVILEVFVIFVAAKVAAEIFVRLRLPQTAGELLVGIILGPHVLHVIELNQAATTLSEIGIVVLLFAVGLETRLSDLLSVGRPALVSSVCGVILAAGTGFALFLGFGSAAPEALFAGTALAASSVGVGARIFSEMGLLDSKVARVVLGAAVVDDVLTLALLPLVQGVGQSGTSIVSVLVGLLGAVVFVVLVAAVGSRLFRRAGAQILDRPRVPGSPFVVAMVICLGLAALAEQVGLAALIGAFLAGMILAETREQFELDRQIHPLYEFLVPFFFVVTGAQMAPEQVFSNGWALPVTVVVVTILAKLVGCGAGAVGLTLRERLGVGAGMVPRIEVPLVVATAGLASGAISQPVFAALVAAVLVSALVAPSMVRAALRRGAGGPAGEPVPG